VGEARHGASPGCQCAKQCAHWARWDEEAVDGTKRGPIVNDTTMCWSGEWTGQSEHRDTHLQQRNEVNVSSAFSRWGKELQRGGQTNVYTMLSSMSRITLLLLLPMVGISQAGVSVSC